MDWIVNEISLSEEEGRGYLEELTIRNFPKDLRIDPQPLIKLAERTTQLKKLKVGPKGTTSKEGRKTLAQFVIQVINSNPASLLELDLWQSGLNKEDGGREILEALHNSTITSLEVVDLGKNPLWWQTKSEEDMDLGRLFTVFIHKQANLKVLSLGGNGLDAEALSGISQALRASPTIFKTLNRLDLSGSYWDTGQAAQHFAELVADSQALDQCFIGGQLPETIIKVTQLPAK